MVCVQLSCVAGHNTSRCVLAQLWCACLASLVIQLQLFDVLVCVCMRGMVSFMRSDAHHGVMEPVLQPSGWALFTLQHVYEV